jgi:hypothetical protein
MIFAQIAAGLKLHLVYEAGEGIDDQHLQRAGTVSAPLCGNHRFNGHYRMTINVPLAFACKRCLKVYQSRYGQRSE